MQIGVGVSVRINGDEDKIVEQCKFVMVRWCGELERHDSTTSVSGCLL